MTFNVTTANFHSCSRESLMSYVLSLKLNPFSGAKTRFFTGSASHIICVGSIFFVTNHLKIAGLVCSYFVRELFACMAFGISGVAFVFLLITRSAGARIKARTRKIRNLSLSLSAGNSDGPRVKSHSLSLQHAQLAAPLVYFGGVQLKGCVRGSTINGGC